MVIGEHGQLGEVAVHHVEVELKAGLDCATTLLLLTEVLDVLALHLNLRPVTPKHALDQEVFISQAISIYSHFMRI